jgi:hypothetical protein
MRILVGFAVFAVFAALSPSLVLAQPPAGKLTPFGEHSERGATRIAFWDNEKNEAVGEVVVAHGRPLWKEGYDAELDAMTRGKMWRMGENFWSWLETNLPLSLAGTPVAPGYYYLVVKRSADGERWSLGLVDPDRTRALRLDAYETTTARAGQVPVVAEIPLAFERHEDVAERLAIRLVRTGEEATRGRLEIRWGHFGLTAPLTITLPALP